MNFSYDVHAQVVRDRQEGLRRDAAAHRLGKPRTLFSQRLRCTAARLRLMPVSPEGCRRRPAAAGSS